MSIKNPCPDTNGRHSSRRLPIIDISAYGNENFVVYEERYRLERQIQAIIHPCNLTQNIGTSMYPYCPCIWRSSCLWDCSVSAPRTFSYKRPAFSPSSSFHLIIYSFTLLISFPFKLTLTSHSVLLLSQQSLHPPTIKMKFSAITTILSLATLAIAAPTVEVPT